RSVPRRAPPPRARLARRRPSPPGRRRVRRRSRPSRRAPGSGPRGGRFARRTPAARRSRCRPADGSFRAPAPRDSVRRVRAVALVVFALVGATVARGERAVEIAGYLGRYDAATVPVWPERLQLLLGGADVEGGLVRAARARAAAAGNPARFLFYL